MRTNVSIEIAAPPELVFALAADVERWPALLPHYERARVRQRRPDGSVVAEFVSRKTILPLVGLGIPIAWRSRVRTEPRTLRIHFRHRGGATDGMAVTWRLEPRDGGCLVTIEHDFGDDAHPLATARSLVIDRLFVRPIASRTLASFQAIAEAAARATSAEPVATRKAPIPTRRGSMDDEGADGRVSDAPARRSRSG